MDKCHKHIAELKTLQMQCKTVHTLLFHLYKFKTGKTAVALGIESSVMFELAVILGVICVALGMLITRFISSKMLMSSMFIF